MVAERGSKRPILRLPVACETTPTIHGKAAGPADASENMMAPMLRAANP